jgi:hypothetical protein
VKESAVELGLKLAISYHTFPATGIHRLSRNPRHARRRQTMGRMKAWALPSFTIAPAMTITFDEVELIAI